MKKDTSTISNAHYEIVSAAKAMGVEPYVIHLAKHLCGNKRKDVYTWVESFKGKVITITIE